MNTEFGLLGTLLIRCDGSLALIPPGKQRVLLAVLLLHANQLVPMRRLAEALWNEREPASARVTVQNYVKRLRQALRDGDHTRISTQVDGYLIRLDARELDVTRFEALYADAQEAVHGRSWHQAADQLRAALSLWRGAPLADVSSDYLAFWEVPRLTEMKLQALEARIDVDMHLGRHAEVISELRQLAAANALREGLHAMLMLALHRCGRQAEAMAVYRGVRRMLAEDLGVEPGWNLRRLHQSILADDPALQMPAAGSHHGGDRGAVPLVPAPHDHLHIRTGVAVPMSDRRCPTSTSARMPQ